MGIPITVIVVDDHKGDQWQLIPCVKWRVSPAGLSWAWWRVFTGPKELAPYQILPIPCFTEWWT